MLKFDIKKFIIASIISFLLLSYINFLLMDYLSDFENVNFFVIIIVITFIIAGLFGIRRSSTYNKTLEQTRYYTAPELKKMKKNIITVAIIVAILLVGGGLLYLGFSKEWFEPKSAKYDSCINTCENNTYKGGYDATNKYKNDCKNDCVRKYK